MALLILAHLYLQIHYPKIHIIYDLGKLACLQLYECYLSHPLSPHLSFAMLCLLSGITTHLHLTANSPLPFMPQSRHFFS